MTLTSEVTPYARLNNWYPCIVLQLALLLTSLVSGGGARDLHVTSHGEDRPVCGSDYQTACRTLAQAVALSQHDDVIFIHKPHRHKTHWFCETEPIAIVHNLTVQAFDDVVYFGCPTKLLMFNLSNTEQVVVFRRLYFLRTLFFVQSGGLEFHHSKLSHCKIHSNNGMFVSLSMFHSESEGDAEPNCTVMCTPTSFQEFNAVNVHLNYYHSRLSQTPIKATVTGAIKLHIISSLFTNDITKKTFLGGIHVKISRDSPPSEIVARNSVFESQVHKHPISSIMNLYEAALAILSGVAISDQNLRDNSGTCTAVVDNCTFRDNERGLTFIGRYKYIRVTNSIFYNNVAMHAGAAILYLTNLNSPSYITNCTFEANAAGSFWPANVKEYEQAFQVSGDEVRIQSKCCKGVISFVGKGGAIRIQKGNLTLNDCRFINNTARLLGGAVFVDRDTSLEVVGTQFENSHIDMHALQGDILYSNGLVSIHSARILAVTARSNVAVLRHSGDHWSVEVSDVSIKCPVGFRLRVTNTSAYGVTSVGLRRSYKLDQLSYFCDSCPRNKYSLDYGYLNYSLQHDAFDYYTLLINGQKPLGMYTGTYIYHDIDCLQCPYGGKCQQGITAAANFWGYVQGTQVRFQHCPNGYCCSSTVCRTFNTCAQNRGGSLCSQCVDGYSEAMFSAECVLDKYCDPTWLLPVALSSGTLYFLFLLFQKDIRDMMFMKTVSPHEIDWPCKRKCCKCCEPDDGHRESLDMAEHNHFLQHNHNNRLHMVARDLTEMQTLNSTGKPDLEFPDESGFLEESNNPDRNYEVEPREAEVPVDMGASFLIILFFYFQDAQLLHIKTVFTSTENKSKSMLKEILSGLFKFRVEVFQFMDKLCFLQDMSPVIKQLIKVAVVPYVLLQFALVYIIYNWCKTIRGRRSSNQTYAIEENTVSLAAATITKSTEAAPKKTFSSRLATGFVLALLFTYQMLATTSFTLLNCVPVGGSNVLFIEGTITCYQMWQYGVMAYAASCISPFCLALLIGPGLLKDGLISLHQFFCALILPLPFLVYWVILRFHLHGKRPTTPPEMSDESQAVIQILQGPFKDTQSKLFGPTCGQGILIGRRLVLVLLFTFVNDTLIRMLCMMLVCFIILLHHVHVLPYKDTRCNLAGSASAAALVIVGGINLVRAGFEAAEYIPQGPNMTLMNVFEELENSLMLWFPAAVMGLVFLSLSVKLILLMLKKLFTSRSTPPTCYSEHA